MLPIKSILLLAFSFFTLSISPVVALARDDEGSQEESLLLYKALETIPGVTKKGESTTLPDYLTSLFNFSIGIVGIAALVMITIGGFWYVTSAGNASRVSTAKSMITDAILGLLVALFAWLILNTINPQLVSRGLSGLSLDATPTRPGDTTLQANQKYCLRTSSESIGGDLSCYNSQDECESAPNYLGQSTCTLTTLVGTTVTDPEKDQFRAPLESVEYCYNSSRGAYGTQELICSGNYSTCQDQSEGKPCSIKSTNPSIHITSDLILEHQKHMEVVQNLNAQGITVNDNFPRTSLAALPDKTTNNLLRLNSLCACDVHVTGGTEPGHQTHGPGKNAVDLRATSSLGVYVVQQSITQEELSNGYYRYTFPSGHVLSGADVVFEKGASGGTHWHIKWN